MKIYDYKAKDKSGTLVKGKVEAASPQQAARLLREKGLVVISISQEREVLAFLRKHSQRASLADVATLTRQFATMITAGLPITDALVIIRSQSKGVIKSVTAEILADVEGGSSLADALSRHPKVFSPVYVALIKAGEGGGVLEDVLNRLADNLEKEREFRSKVKGALIYPIIIIIGMVIVSIIMLVFVVPRITSFYKEFDATLPLATRVLISVSGFFQKFVWVLPAAAIGGFWFFKAFAKTPAGRVKIDSFKFKLPIFGNLYKQVLLTEFTRTLGLLVSAGISIVEGLKMVAAAVDNAVLALSIKKASGEVEKGFSLAYALSQSPESFPPLLFQMLSVGEETGKLDEVLAKVSHIFEQESESQVKGLTAAIEPVIMVILGIGVGFLVIAVLLPMYNLTSRI